MRNGFAPASGTNSSAGKHYYVSLAADIVGNVNAVRAADGVKYARKVMIRTGLAFSINGQGEESRLFRKIHEIVRKYRNHFDGAPVVDVDDE